jgi:hypothetical protein
MSAKGRKSRRATVEDGGPSAPDDRLLFGGIRIERFGKLIRFVSERTDQEQAEFEHRLAERYPNLVGQIQARVDRIRELVVSCEPLELMHRCYWGFVQSMLGKKAESECSPEDIVAHRMLEYVQSVIVASPPAFPQRAPDDERWTELRREVGQLYDALHFAYHVAHTAWLKLHDTHYDPEWDQFYVQAQMFWTGVRANRYPVHDVPHLMDLLSPHAEVFLRLFGLSVRDFVEGAAAIQRALCVDRPGALQGLAELRDEVDSEVAKRLQDKSGSPDDVAQEVRAVMEAGRRSLEALSLLKRAFGLDLFDLTTITSFPVSLLEELSLGPGTYGDLFAPGDYPGWPLRLLPTRVRPFLKANGSFYCFDPINFMDNLYRIMQRLVCRLDPRYAEDWNRKQKEVSERLPFDLLTDLMPGASVHRPVWYPSKVPKAGKTEWCETDGLLAFDDLLFVVEVKAGSFTSAPPATDFQSHVDSLRSLLLGPATQAQRFIEYLESEDSVSVFGPGPDHGEVARLQRKAFRVVVPLSVSLDDLTFAAYQAQRLASLGVAPGRPLWSLTIDDLRVYGDVFSSGVTFAHYAGERLRAESAKGWHVDDELDHLGLYLKHCPYVRYATELAASLKAPIDHWAGFRRTIDEFFYDLFADPKAAQRPRVNVGPRTSRILAWLDAHPRAGRCRVAAVILGMHPDTRADFERQIDLSLSKSQRTGSVVPFHLVGESPVTVFCWTPAARIWGSTESRNYTWAWMLRTGDDERTMVWLTFDGDGQLASVAWEFLRIGSVPPDQRTMIEDLSKQQAARRLSQRVAREGRIGRNEPCPCGSGRRYKRCCGR